MKSRIFYPSLTRKPEEKDRKILRRIDENAGDEFAFLRDLIKVPSLPGTRAEGQAQRVVRNKLQQIAGITIDEWEPDLRAINRYRYHPIRERTDGWNYDGRPVVVGMMDGSSERSLILNAHIDVVSPEPLSAWTTSPWDAGTSGGKMFGRGANDTKGGLASIIYAVKSLVECGLRPKGRVIIESVPEEEFGGGGTIATLLKGYTASAALVAEPSGVGNLCLGSGGSRFFKIRLLGRSEAPQAYRRGVDAIEMGYRIYAALVKFNLGRERRLRGKHPSFERKGEGVMFGDGRPTNLVVGRFSAGDFPAKVPGWATMEGRIGFPVGESGDEIRKDLADAVLEAAAELPWLSAHPPTVDWFNAQREPYELSPSEPFIQTVRSCIHRTLGRPPTTFSTPSSSDAVFFANRVGKFVGVPVAVYGPRGGNAHGPDEVVYLSEIIPTTGAIALTLKDWCGFN